MNKILSFFGMSLFSTLSWATTSHLPPQANKYAAEVDSLYSFLLWASLISCILVIGGMVYFVLAYKRKSDEDETPYISHNNTLEFLWSFIPFLIFMVVFVWGWKLFYQAENAPKNAFEIHVFGRQWAWDFQYKSGRITTNEIVIPVNKPIKLIMTSKDVLHSFFIPSFRVKQDVIPGAYTSLWFEAEKLGEFQVYCTEYCGAEHSGMLAKIKVVTMSDFEDWLADDPSKKYEGMPLAERGEIVVKEKACTACHNFKSDVPGALAPGLKGLIGRERKFADGSSLVADEAYIRASIKGPQDQVVADYAGKAPMPMIPVTEEEITWIIEYIKSNSK